MNNQNNIYPYSDELMIWDEKSNRYYLTENALLDNGIDLRSRLGANDTVNAYSVINRLLKHTTTMIYNYIHSFSIDNSAQDRLISSIPSLRSIIYDALVLQVEYILLNGDFSRSAEPAKRTLAIDDNAKQRLSDSIPELGVSILYAGGR